jgi:hypothetical protein
MGGGRSFSLSILIYNILCFNQKILIEKNLCLITNKQLSFFSFEKIKISFPTHFFPKMQTNPQTNPQTEKVKNHT